ncbi:hypothetical protein KR009_009541, partial [Drosophila setifemur]
MERVRLGEKLYIRRSDGRVHPAICTEKNPELDLITVEWTEGSVVSQKQAPISLIVGLNSQIFKQQPAAMASPYAGPSRVGEFRASPSSRPIPKRTRTPPNRASGGEGVGGSSTARAAPRRSHNSAQGGGNTTVRCSSVVREVERMKEQREQRRARQVEQRLELNALRRQDPGNPNWEVALMLRNYRETIRFSPLRSLDPNGAVVQQITVCVRKRPMSRREERVKNVDIITVATAESLIVHELRHKVDLTKFLEHHRFRFDYTFDEKCSNSLVYEHTARPLIRTMFEGGNATCFAYGQTGSGKTHTMGGVFCGKVQNSSTGIYAMAARDVFQEVARPEYKQMGAKITCSFFEIYGPKVYDLLHPDKPMLRVLEDGRQQVVVVGLTEMPVTKVEDVLRLIDLGNRERTSGQTSVNAKSSRSHAVFQMALHMPDSWGPFGKCSFVDLAGNERGADTQSADRQTRIEGAEINKSLLALKECIRALSRQSGHLPFRGSKLTQVLRDSFIGGKKNKTCMIAMVSPAMSCVEHTLNTLRYADRVKELVAKEDESPPAAELEESVDPPESEPENIEGDVAEESHITVSSEDPSSYFQHSIPTDLDFSTSCILIDDSTDNSIPSGEPVKLDQVAEEHAALVDHLENFVQSFRNLNLNQEFLSYIRSLDTKLQELTAKVNQTRNLVLHYNAQEFLKGVLINNPKIDGNIDDEL